MLFIDQDKILFTNRGYTTGSYYKEKRAANVRNRLLGETKKK